jgi:DNA-binding FadR family transcriptional regulator
LITSRTILKRARPVPLPPLTLDRRRPLAGQIARGIRIAIQTGRLCPGDRLPATRRLAQALGVSRQVIVTAYEELTAGGYVAGRTGDGSYVQGASGTHVDAALQRAPTSTSAFAPASTFTLTATRTPMPARRTITDPDGHAIRLWPLS